MIPFIYNLLKLHPSCMTLIHRPAVEGYEDEILGGKYSRLPFRFYETISS